MEQFLNTLLPKGVKMILRLPGLPDREVVSAGSVRHNSGCGFQDTWVVNYLDPANKVVGAIMPEYVFIKKAG